MPLLCLLAITIAGFYFSAKYIIVALFVMILFVGSPPVFLSFLFLALMTWKLPYLIFAGFWILWEMVKLDTRPVRVTIVKDD